MIPRLIFKHDLLLLFRTALAQIALHSNAKDVLVIDSNEAVLRSVTTFQPSVKTTNKSISRLDIANQSITFTDGNSVTYEKCLLAIGKEGALIPKQYLSDSCPSSRILDLPPNSAPLVSHLRHLLSNNGHVTLLGGSWNSVALASYLASIQASPGQVTMVMPGSAPLCQILPRYLSEALCRRLRRQGIDVLQYSQVSKVELS